MTNYYKKQWPVDETESWQNGKLVEWQVDKMTWHLISKFT
jgi:hypothetical protein